MNAAGTGTDTTVHDSGVTGSKRFGPGDSGASPRSLSGPVEMEQAPRIAN